jgi:uncharacterized metal-binding protein
MFGPDLDVYSRQYRRWGMLRWIWIPYQRGMRHRSFWSHGPVVGTAVRILYLSAWLGLAGILVIVIAAIALQINGDVDDWYPLAQFLFHSSTEFLARSLSQYPGEALALAIGLELGALSHSLSDWLGSTGKRWNKSKFRPATTKPLPPRLKSPSPDPAPRQEAKLPPFLQSKRKDKP